MPDSTPIVSSHGTAQKDRFLKPLDFDYVKVDERTFEDLVVFVERLSRLINYYNLENEPEGDWSGFLNDEIIILASIIDANPTEVEKRFREHLYKFSLFNRVEKKKDYLKRCFKHVYDVAFQFDYWYKKLKATDEYDYSQQTIKAELANAISSRLGPVLARLKALEMGLAKRKVLNLRIGLEYDVFDLLWQLEAVKAESSLFEGYDTEKQKLALLAEPLQLIFQPFYETLIYLKRKAPDFIQESFKKDTHRPETALLFTFLKLYDHAQGKLNQFNEKYLKYYYEQVLQQNALLPRFDHVYLKLGAGENVLFLDIDEGTPFIAGEDQEGNSIIYKADYPIRVTKAVMKKLHTVFLEKQILNVKGVGRPLIAGIYGAMPSVQETFQEQSQESKKSHPTFGESQTGKGSFERSMEDARIGFAVSSPSLTLREGHREISLTFFNEKESFKTLLQYLSDIGTTTDSGQQEVFIKTFLEAFQLEITTEEGWYSVNRYVVGYSETENSLRIRFDMEEDEPPIVRFDSDIHEGSFDTGYPTVKFLLNNDAYVYAYSLLQQLIVEQVLVETDIYGAKELSIYNQISELSLDSPFMPFGPLPTVGSYLVIGSNEIFQKSLDKLQINIEWFDLPKHRSGFFGHYENYGIELDNTSFEVKLSILDGGRWKPLNEAEQQSFKLFRTEDNGLTDDPQDKGTLLSQTLLRGIHIPSIKQPHNFSELESGPAYFTNTSRRGYIKLEFSAPTEGFAHDIYPTALFNHTLKNAKNPGILKRFQGNKPKTEPPRPPHSPQIRKLTLDYSSSSLINLTDRSAHKNEEGTRGEFFHLHPFGKTKVYPDNSKQFTRILPDYQYEGCLMLGFSGLNPPERLTILFEMIDEFTITSEADPPVVIWSYLKDDEWVHLESSKVIKDTTNSFLRTGIIEIILPYDFSDGNTILDPDLFWLRAAVMQNIEEASNLVSVTTQVVTATLEGNNNLETHLTQPLPPFTINRSVENIQGLESVLQPLPSYRGLPEEKPSQFYTRIGERLRHKNRAVTAWDYEHLILDKFPEIYKVTCLPDMSSRSLDDPGHVLVVVVPHPDYMPNHLEPMASNELLYQIKNFLSNLTSPFIRLEVRNPSYERVKIMCSVKFGEGYNYGYYIQRLNEKINEYLSGSSFTGRKSMELGGTAHSSDVLSFMRTLPYVEFITRFSMVQAAMDFKGRYVLIDTAREGDEKESLRATKPWSVLVPAETHQIEVLGEKVGELSTQAGIGYLELGHDFIVG